MNPNPCLAVLVPVFNEALTVRIILEKVLAQPSVKEVIAVDDGSSDGSRECLEICARLDKRVRVFYHKQNCGKGAAIKTALKHVTSPLVVIQDGDLELDPIDYAKLLGPILRGEANVVYGSRFATANNDRVGAWHVLSNRMLTSVANLVTGLKLTDEATCYKMFRRELLIGLNLQEDGFGFCSEVTAKLARANVKIVEVPIYYLARSRAMGKKLRLRDGCEAVYCLLKYYFAPINH